MSLELSDREADLGDGFLTRGRVLKDPLADLYPTPATVIQLDSRRRATRINLKPRRPRGPQPPRAA